MAFRTFFVEDNPVLRESLVGTLRELAQVVSVGEAEDQDEASDWLTQHPAAWDLAIVDLALKHGTGLQVLAACRHRSPSQRMVVLSGQASPEIRYRCAQLGADAVFDKATELDALIDYCARQHDTLAGANRR
ncbi:MAG: response regulator [Comamonadaceae bacterium]|nr:MAG: response regulator [Comamonadaceae bacterium]